MSTALHRPTLVALSADVGPAAAVEFADRVRTCLRPRLRELARAVRAGDAEGAHVTALSLRCAADMVGGGALAETLSRIVPSLRAGDLHPARSALADLSLQTLAVHGALTAYVAAA